MTVVEAAHRDQRSVKRPAPLGKSRRVVRERAFGLARDPGIRCSVGRRGKRRGRRHRGVQPCRCRRRMDCGRAGTIIGARRRENGGDEERRETAHSASFAQGSSEREWPDGVRSASGQWGTQNNGPLPLGSAPFRPCSVWRGRRGGGRWSTRRRGCGVGTRAMRRRRSRCGRRARVAFRRSGPASWSRRGARRRWRVVRGVRRLWNSSASARRMALARVLRSRRETRPRSTSASQRYAARRVVSSNGGGGYGGERVVEQDVGAAFACRARFVDASAPSA